MPFGIRPLHKLFVVGHKYCSRDPAEEEEGEEEEEEEEEDEEEEEEEEEKDEGE